MQGGLKWVARRAQVVAKRAQVVAKKAQAVAKKAQVVAKRAQVVAKRAQMGCKTLYFFSVPICILLVRSKNPVSLQAATNC